MTIKNCPVCNSTNCSVSHANGNDYVYNCDNCGHYVLDEACCGFDSNTRHLIAGYLYETKNNHIYGKTRVDHFNKENTEKLLASSVIPKTSMQRLDKLLLNIYKEGKGFNSQLKTNIPAIGYAENVTELGLMIEALINLNYIHETYSTLTIHGLQHAESLLTENKNSTKVFIAMKFSDYMKKLRDESIMPACDKCGFEANTVDGEEYNGDITDKIISSIKTSRFVIADFTCNNLGVYYEAGYAKGLGIPVIKTCKKEWFDEKDDNGNKINRLHFDIEHDNLILWENEEDLRDKLESRIKAVIL